MTHKSYILSLLPIVIILSIGGVFSYINSSHLYTQHQKLWEYRRLTPEILPSPLALRVLAVWHDTSYADALWIGLIQFIWDNIGNGNYLEFTHKILSLIQDLHPRFTRAYELDLLLLPIVSPEDESDSAIAKREKLKIWLADYESIIPRVCDMKKVTQIDSLGFGEELWSREDLKNPCLSWYIPYYMAIRYDADILDRARAIEYYKLASMHDDAPSASRFLGILAYSSDGNYRDGALSFVLMAAEWDDEDPYLCQALSLRLIKDLSARIPWTVNWIDELEREERLLQPPKDSTNPFALAGWNCYESLERGVKQIYLWYITGLTQDIDVTTGKELIDLKILDHIPTVQSQSGFTVSKKNDRWRYILYTPEDISDTGSLSQ